MFVFSGLDRLEVPRLGGAGNFPHVWGVVFPGCSGRFVVLTTEDSQVGRPPRFEVVGRPGYGRMLLEEGYQTIQRF